MPPCPACSAQLSDEARFCGRCGRSVPAPETLEGSGPSPGLSLPSPASAGRFCGFCGTRMPADASFCEGCGNPAAPSQPSGSDTSGTTGPAAAPPPQARGRPDPERRARVKMGMVAAAIGLVIGAGGATALRIIQNHHPPSPSIVGAAAPKLPALAQFGAVPTTPSSTLGPVQLTAQPGLPVGGVDIASRATVTGPPEPPPGNDDPPGFGPFTPQSTVDGAKGGWRVPGDASGDTLTLTFPAPVTFRAVGLDPGDDAVGPDGSDLWPTRRAVSQATFTFDDGSSVIVTFTTDASTPPSERLLLAYLQAPETSATIKIHIDSTQSALEAGFPDQTVITRIAVLGA